MALTLGLRDGAGDGGAGGGDGAHRGAHPVGRVHTRHGRRVGHPCGRVNGPYRLTYRGRTKGQRQTEPGDKHTHRAQRKEQDCCRGERGRQCRALILTSR